MSTGRNGNHVQINNNSNIAKLFQQDDLNIQNDNKSTDIQDSKDCADVHNKEKNADITEYDSILKFDSYTLKNFTACNKEELLQILEWRNAPEVRESSFSHSVISEQDHLRYIDFLKHRLDLVYFMVMENDQKLGTISFTKTCEHTAEIGYYKSLDVASRKGVGKLLLDIATKASLMLTNPKFNGQILRLQTHVFSDNIPSIISIERAGYKKCMEKRYSSNIASKFSKYDDEESPLVYLYKLELFPETENKE